MFKKKDYELIAEAYDRVFKLNECWSDAQKEKYDALVKSGFKEVSKDESKKTVTVEKNLDGTKETFTIDQDGKEHKHYEQVKESSIELDNDPRNLSRKFIVDAAKDFTNNRAHGRLAGYRYAVEGGKQGIVPPNPHTPGTPAAKNWQEGFDEILQLNDKANKKEVEAGGVATKTDGAAFKESKCTCCTKGCRCGNCEGCMKKEGEEVCSKCHYLKSKCQCSTKNESLQLADLYSKIIEEAKKKTHVFTKVEKAAEKAGYSKKAAEKIAGAQKAKMRKKGMVKEEYEEQMPDSRENAETAYGVDSNEAADYEEVNSFTRKATDVVLKGLLSNNPHCEAALQKDGTIHFVFNDKGYTITVEQAKW